MAASGLVTVARNLLEANPKRHEYLFGTDRGICTDILGLSFLTPLEKA